MGDFIDRQKLLALDGDQVCSSCGIGPIPPESCEVVDGEVVCIDCCAEYHPETYQRRTSD